MTKAATATEARVEEMKAVEQPVKASGVETALIAFVVVLCIACCTLILLIPTSSLNVNTVYQGF